ncbi:putative leucine-rich repeat-containing protein DDB_G0290503 [Mytilus edulis]|uniref:putative leucine-rich repeat-containing protein DDB_G0290503 n=1 Tax=Mytilus edulis TaxID=6550 RepID=UPI0039EED94E
MILIFISMLVIGISNGFLLASKNTSSLTGKPAYLTTAEYYEDRNKIRHDQETYRDQQEKTLNLLTNQLQQKFDIIERILGAQTSNNGLNETKKTIDALEQKYRELELKYKAVQSKLTTKEQMYNELVQNFTVQQQDTTYLKQEITNLHRDLNKVETKCNDKTNSAVNKTLALEEKIGKLEQLKNIDQLQTLQTLQGQVQTFDSRINLLTSHEQARNQDFLALYNLTTSSKHELENKMNNQLQSIEKSLSNLISESRNENEKVVNRTMKEINELANHSTNEIEQMGRYHNSSFSLFQQNLDKQLQKVVVTGCYGGSGGLIPAGPLKFPDIKTSVGVSNLSTFQSTGKFTCQVPGYYHIVTTIMSANNNARIDIMKNSNSIHWQFVTGHHDGYWKPGTAVVALELKTNDNVWIKLSTTYNIYQSCLTIFKIN